METAQTMTVTHKRRGDQTNDGDGGSNARLSVLPKMATGRLTMVYFLCSVDYGPVLVGSRRCCGFVPLAPYPFSLVWLLKALVAGS
jgi:hypothetical protein